MDGLWQSPYGMNWLTIGNGQYVYLCYYFRMFNLLMNIA